MRQVLREKGDAKASKSVSQVAIWEVNEAEQKYWPRRLVPLKQTH